MVGDTNLFLSEGGKYAEVSTGKLALLSIMKTFLVADSLRVDPEWIQVFDDLNN
jgi:hypothetical protein